MKKMIALLLTVFILLSLIPAAALAKGKEGPTDPSPNQINYGSSYNHIDVKVDGQYTASVDGNKVTLSGTLDSKSIIIKVGSKTFNFADYNVKTQTEGGHSEYDVSVRNLSPNDISWESGTYNMSNVYVSARMLFDTVPDSLKNILQKNSDGKWYVDITDYKYSGVQECTGGNGMRSEGNSGTPSGLDLYIEAKGLEVYITKGKLAISKVIADETGKAVSDTSSFTFTLEDSNGYVYFLNNKYTSSSTSGASSNVTVNGGSTVTLENLPAGTYTITEVQKDGYVIRDIDGEYSNKNYSKDYIVEVKEDTDIPTATFTNTRLSQKAGIEIKKAASGLDKGVSYPDPAVSIYAAGADGAKTGSALWSGTLDANGDTLYPSLLLAKGSYVVEETGAEVVDYNCTEELSVNGSVNDGMVFRITDADLGKRIVLALENTYTKQPEFDDTIDIPVKKIWEHGSNIEANYPASVTVKLMNGQIEAGSLTLTAADADSDGNWTGVFTEVPGFDANGAAINYTVAEVSVPGYTTTVTQQPARGSVSSVSGWSQKYTPASNSQYDIGSANLIAANKGSNYYVWTLTALDAAQKQDILAKINAANLAGMGKTLTVKNTVFKSGLPAVFDEGSGNSVTIETVGGKNLIKFGTTASWSLFYTGAAVITPAKGAEIKNTFNEPTTGSLTVSKTFGANSQLAAEDFANGISFTVTGPESYSSTFTLQENGAWTKTLSDLTPGEYTVTESADVPGYERTTVFSSTGGKAVVAAGGSVQITVNNSYVKKTGTDTVHDSITVNKTDGTSELGGATFGLFTDELCATAPIKTFTAGTAVISTSDAALAAQLPTAGGSVTLYLKETLAPADYTGSETVYPITISAAAGEELDEVQDKFITTTTYSMFVNGQSKEVTVVNTLKTGSLTLTKEIGGTAASKDDEFTFKVMLTDADGKPVNASFKYEGTSDGTAAISGVITSGGTVALKGGGSITISGIPVGTSYKAEETDAKGYEMSAKGDMGTISSDAVSKAAFTNIKNIAVTSVTVNKAWNDANWAGRPNAVKMQLFKDGVKYGDAVTLEAKTGWTYTWNNLATDAVWTVDEVEVPSGYRMSSVRSGNVFTVINTRISSVPQTGDDSSPLAWIIAGTAALAVIAALFIILMCRRKAN